MDDDEIKTIINDSKFKSVWGELKGDELKTAPRNFDKDHEAINLIKKKQYIFTKQFTDVEVCKDDFAQKVNDYFKTIRPFFDYMSDVLTTDLNGVSLIKD